MKIQSQKTHLGNLTCDFPEKYSVCCLKSQELHINYLPAPGADSSPEQGRGEERQEPDDSLQPRRGVRARPPAASRGDRGLNNGHQVLQRGHRHPHRELREVLPLSRVQPRVPPQQAGRIF